MLDKAINPSQDIQLTVYKFRVSIDLNMHVLGKKPRENPHRHWENISSTVKGPQSKQDSIKGPPCSEVIHHSASPLLPSLYLISTGELNTCTK